MQTRYCCEFIKILNFLKRKDKKTHILWLINKYHVILLLFSCLIYKVPMLIFFLYYMYLVSVLVNWFSFLFCNLFFDECWLSNRPNLVIGFQDTYQKPGISLISSLYMSWIFCSIKSGSYTIGVKPLIIPPTTKFVVGRSILVSPCPSVCRQILCRTIT